MLKLYQFAPVNGQNVSPFCLKVEAYCRLANIPYQIVETMPDKSPTGKLPFIEDNGKIVADSRRIIDYLKKNYGDHLDRDLSEEDKAFGHSLNRLCEESFYPVVLYSRWGDDDLWPMVKAWLFSSLPPVIRYIVPEVLRYRIKKTLHYQSYRGLSKPEIYQMGFSDIKAMAILLSKHSLAIGHRPTSFDATLYAFLSVLVKSPLEDPLKRQIERHKILVSYIARMDEMFRVKEENRQLSF